MPVNYSGNPTGVQAPAVAPGPGVVPVLALPIDTDALNSAAFYQPFKALADNLANAISFRSGRFYERWDIAAQTISAQTQPIADLAKRWNFNLNAGTGSVQFQDPSATYPSRAALVTTSTGSQVALETSFPLWYSTWSGRLSLEFDLKPTSTTTGIFGLTGGALTGVPGQDAGFMISSGSFLATAGGTIGNFTQTTGVTATAGTWYKMKILFDSTLGTCLFYINDNLTNTFTGAAHLPSNNPAAMGLGFSGTFTVGEVGMAWTRL